MFPFTLNKVAYFNSLAPITMIDDLRSQNRHYFE